MKIGVNYWNLTNYFLRNDLIDFGLSCEGPQIRENRPVIDELTFDKNKEVGGWRKTETRGGVLDMRCL